MYCYSVWTDGVSELFPGKGGQKQQPQDGTCRPRFESSVTYVYMHE